MFRKNAKTRNWSWMMLSLIVVGAVLVFVLSARATTSAVSAYNDIHGPQLQMGAHGQYRFGAKV